MSAGVMAANIIWNAAKSTNGTVVRVDRLRLHADAVEEGEVEAADDARGRPTSGAKARLKPTMTQTTVTRARPKKLCMIVESTFLARTRPP